MNGAKIEVQDLAKLSGPANRLALFKILRLTFAKDGVEFASPGGAAGILAAASLLFRVGVCRYASAVS